MADVNICDFVSDHVLDKCTIAFPCQVAHNPNIVQYRRYHYINMSDFRTDLKNTSFVKSPADAVVDLYEQYVHHFHLGNVLDRHAPLISRLTKIPQIGCLMIIDMQGPLGANLREPCVGAKSPLNRRRLCRQTARCNALVNKDKLDCYSKLISDNSHDS